MNRLFPPSDRDLTNVCYTNYDLWTKKTHSNLKTVDGTSPVDVLVGRTRDLDITWRDHLCEMCTVLP